jgi:hypothetical protein
MQTQTRIKYYSYNLSHNPGRESKHGQRVNVKLRYRHPECSGGSHSLRRDGKLREGTYELTCAPEVEDRKITGLR